jgi:hypothetical protein
LWIQNWRNFSSLTETPIQRVQEVSRVINLGTDPITVRSTVNEAFESYGSTVTYANFEQLAQEQMTSLSTENTVVVLSEDVAVATTPAAQSGYTDSYPTDSYSSDPYADPYQQQLPDCGRARYSLVPIDRCMIDRLGRISGYVLNGGIDPTGFVVVTSADPTSTYFNVVTGETGSLTPGMTLPEGSIIRTSSDGLVSTVFPNGSTMNVEAASNVYVESIASHPVFSRGDVDQQTNITVRVESGMLTANTMNISSMDTFQVISPLDRHFIASNSAVSVAFSQKDTNLFETISQNETEGAVATFNTVVVTDAPEPSNVGGNFTFVEYSAEGNTLSFTTPPAYGHITESAVIPPDYDFIDRTIAFAAGAIAGPTPVGTPNNPGDDFRINDEPPSP